MPDALAVEKVEWKPLVGSVLTTGLDSMVTTDSQEKRPAEMLRSYRVTFCGSLVFCRMFFFKTEKKTLKGKRNHILKEFATCAGE